MRIIICDDDRKVAEEIAEIIHSYHEKNKLLLPEIALFYSGESLIADKKPKDIVFLDIEMMGINGILVGKKLAEENKDVIIIIVTSYNEYIDDAMRIKVFRYISKPIDNKRLIRNYMDALSAFLSRKEQMIPIETDDKMLSCCSSDIIMLKTDRRKTLIYTSNETIVSNTLLQEWISLLPSVSFYQPHRSYIINLSHVQDFTHDEIKMKDGSIAFLARRNYSDFKKKWLTYLSVIN